MLFACDCDAYPGEVLTIEDYLTAIFGLIVPLFSAITGTQACAASVDPTGRLPSSLGQGLGQVSRSGTRLPRCVGIQGPSIITHSWLGTSEHVTEPQACRIVRAASKLEMAQLLECEVDPTVEAFCEQPIRIQYNYQGVCRRDTPYLLIFHHTPPHEIREIKPENKAANPENESRWPAIGEALNSIGFSFQVYTERQLNVRATPVRAIFRDRHSELPS